MIPVHHGRYIKYCSFSATAQFWKGRPTSVFSATVTGIFSFLKFIFCHYTLQVLILRSRNGFMKEVHASRLLIRNHDETCFKDLARIGHARDRISLQRGIMPPAGNFVKFRIFENDCDMYFLSIIVHFTGGFSCVKR